MSFPVQCCRIIISILLLFSGTVNDNNCDGNFFSKLEKPIRVNLNNFHPTVILHDFRDAVKPQSIVASRKLVWPFDPLTTMHILNSGRVTHKGYLLVVVIYQNVTLQVDHNRQNIFRICWSTCNVTWTLLFLSI